MTKTTKKKVTKKVTKKVDTTKTESASPGRVTRLRKWVGTISWSPAFGDLFRTVNRLAFILGWGILITALGGLVCGVFLPRL